MTNCTNLDLTVKSPVFNYTEENVRTIFKLHEKTTQDVFEDIRIIEEWLVTQPHLPKPYPDQRVILNFLLRNKFSIERTKQKLDAYCSIPGLLPEVYANRLPDSESMIKTRKFFKMAALPNLENNNRILISYIDDKDLIIDGLSILARLTIGIELLNLYDFSNKLEIILDCRKVTFNNIKSLNLSMLTKMILISEKVVSHRVKMVHFVQLPNFAMNVIRLAQPLLPEKIRHRYKIHKSLHSLLDDFSKECLPKEFGGDGPELASLAGDLESLALQNIEHYQMVQNYRVDESLRPTRLDNDEFLGYHGSFKQLQVD